MVPGRGPVFGPLSLKKDLSGKDSSKARMTSAFSTTRAQFFMVYVDDIVLVGPKAEELEEAYQVIKAESSPGANDGSNAMKTEQSSSLNLI